MAVGNAFNPTNFFDLRTFNTCAYEPEQLAAGETRIFQCQEPIAGRYVTIYLNHRSVLTLCEVEVYQMEISGIYKNRTNLFPGHIREQLYYNNGRQEVVTSIPFCEN